MTLDEIADYITTKADELDVEGLNSVDYWLMRAGYGEHEFFTFAGTRCREMVDDADSLEKALLGIWVDAFVVGFISGRRGGQWPD